MKSGKDEEKTMGPMFPRLHVNDTERGGPRAPPRNKMALYEQLSIPSQRFNSRQPLTSPLQHNNSCSSVLPATSSQGGVGPERSVVSPFYITPSTPAHSTERLHSNSSDGVNLNTKSMDFEQKSMENRNYRTSNATGPMFSTAEGNSFHPNNSFGKKVGDEDDYVVPTFVHYGNTPLSTKDQPMQQIARDKLLEQNNPVDLNSAQRVRNLSEENQKDSVSYRECVEKPNSQRSTRETFAEPLKHTYVFSNQEQQNSPVGNSGRFYSPVAELHQEYRDGLPSGNTVCSGHILAQPMEGEKENSRVRINPCSRSSFPSLHVSHNQAENGSQYHEDQVRGSLQVGDVDRNDDLSETSMVDSISALDISPDDVVGVIGQKHFWKARRAIVNQQRVFAVQVFELHRLIKVQQLIAGSPHLLLEDNPYLGKPSLKVSPAKRLPLEYVIKSPPRIVKQNDYQKPNQTDGKSDNAVKKFPLPSLSNDASQGLRHQNSNCEPYSGNQPPPSITNDTKTGPWCFHPPPGNQWLVPVMSPSEGLIYKPYGGPCPPNAGFLAPLYGGCRPLSVPSAPGDFLPPVYGIPAPHQQGFTVLSGGPPPGQTYFSPYGMPVMNPVMTGAQPHSRSEQLSTGNFERETISSGVRRFRTSKESEIQGSTASSPSERSQGGRVSQITEGNDALPLFPTDPVTTGAHSGDQRTRVIKVVPHNPRSATESAARIFRSIQAERLQHESE